MLTQDKAVKLNVLSAEGKEARYKESFALGRKIEQVIPGGVDSPFRAFHEVGGQAIFFERGEGAYLYDLDGNKYLDYLGAWGPAIAGHAPSAVTTKTQEILIKGPVFGAPHTLEFAMAQRVIEAIPNHAVEMIRFVSSGTEAVMSAIRLARGYSGKSRIMLFEGGYHGHSDSTLASTTHQASSGIPRGLSEETIQCIYNDLVSVEATLQKYPNEIAAVIVEPVCGSMGVVVPQPGFLEGLRELCTKYSVLLIFDEVITGFRLAYGGAQEYYKVKADITCFGKALGGGMPIGAYGASKEIMAALIPGGDVYQAGTFSGNPLTMAGGVAILDLLKATNPYEHMDYLGQILEENLNQVIKEEDYPLTFSRAGSMFSLNFAREPITNFSASKKVDTESYARFFHLCLDSGIYLPPSAQDAACISSAHSLKDIQVTSEIMQAALAKVFELP
jgi:glutamate-1-semialdehyde 2,1-aminomutase